MLGNFPSCLAFTLKYEGGWSDHPSDPGGATMKGVTLATYRRYYPNATKLDLRSISDAQLHHIYMTGYWEPIKGDALPSGVDLVAFDVSVNSGAGRARQWLSDTAGIVDAVARVKALCKRRMGFWQGLRTWRVFGKGWAARGAACEAAALKMAGAKSEFLIREASKASTASGKAKAAVKASATSGAGGSVAAITSAPDYSLWIAGSLAVLVGVIILICVARSCVHASRAEALLEAAK